MIGEEDEEVWLSCDPTISRSRPPLFLDLELATNKTNSSNVKVTYPTSYLHRHHLALDSRDRLFIALYGCETNLIPDPIPLEANNSDPDSSEYGSRTTEYGLS